MLVIIKLITVILLFFQLMAVF